MTTCPHCGSRLRIPKPIPKAVSTEERRQALLTALRAVPGASVRYLAKQVGLASGSSALTHLRALEKQGKVVQTAGRWRVKGS